ncbi:glycosyltransferase family 4 protein [Occallatibacter savannae]|uniref:glycosyltransferase family 4 protein n=1 Tax=Occallatibacter savannae TaxID=1002691 RepID=UPI0013A58957|nr:glycosyltransferase family 4 protein [Occallatibacter savannae]
MSVLPADRSELFGTTDSRPHILVGVTSAQTCILLPARSQALMDAGFRVSIVSGPGAMSAGAKSVRGVSTHVLPMEREIAGVRDLIAFCRLLRLLNRIKPDIVEFSTPKAGLLGIVAAWIHRVPVRVYFLRGLRVETCSGLMRMILLWSERLAAACSHVVVANSKSLGRRAHELGISNEKKTRTLGEGSSNGVDALRFSPGESGVREEWGIPASARVIGFVGRLTVDKGVPELLEAFAKILRRQPDCYLLLVGWFDAASDALGRGLRERIEGHPRIVCTGYVADAAPYYRAMDVMVLPSWREGFPNVVLEAAASGVPAVATTCTGSCDAVVPEVTGLLVPPGYADAIAEAVLRLLGDEDLRAKMGEAARKWAVEHFEQQRVLRMTVLFYEELLRGRNRSPSTKIEALTE